MAANIITTDDLMEFKLELLDEIKLLLSQQTVTSQKRYIKSVEVMKLLQISPGTLQNLRINRTLPFTKIGGIIYYDLSDIHDLMKVNKVSDSEEL